MSLDTSAAAGHCDQLRVLEHQQWRESCDEIQARKQGRAAHFGGSQGQGNGGDVGEGW